MSPEKQCAYCGMPLSSWNKHHTNEDCEKYLIEHPEGGLLFEKLRTKTKLCAEEIEQ